MAAGISKAYRDSILDFYALVGLWIRYVKLTWTSQMEYRGSFLLGRLAQFVSYGVDVLVVWIVVTRFERIGTWTAEEVVFLHSVNVLTYAMAGFAFFHPMTELAREVRDGTFDLSLVRPRNPLMYTLMKGFTFGYMGHVALGFVVLWWASSVLQIQWTIINAIYLVVFLIGGAMIQAAAFLWLGAVTLWFVQAHSLGGIFWIGRSMIRYPITIYPPFVQIVLTVVIPFGFVNFYPVQYFLEKNDFGLFHPSIQHGTVFVGIVTIGLMVRFFNFCVGRYQSTGS